MAAEMSCCKSACREQLPAAMALGDQSGEKRIGSNDTTNGGEKQEERIQAEESGLGIDQRAKHFISTLNHTGTHLGAVLANFQLN